MYTLKVIAALFLFSVITHACNQPNEQLEQERVKQLEQDAMKQMKAWIQQKTDAQAELQKTQNSLAVNKNEYENLIAKIEAQKARLVDIKGFQFLRSSQEKEIEIENQVKYIRELEANIPELEKVIQEQNAHIQNLEVTIEKLSIQIEDHS